MQLQNVEKCDRFSIPHSKKNQKSSYKLSTCTLCRAPLYDVLYLKSQAIRLPSYALLLCPWHWRKIRNITTWKSTERALSLTLIKSINPNFCMKMPTCSLYMVIWVGGAKEGVCTLLKLFLIEIVQYAAN